MQKISTTALREGLLKYDKRKGWRGALLNKKYSADWNNNLDKYSLEKTLGWELAIVKKIEKFLVEIETEK